MEKEKRAWPGGGGAGNASLSWHWLSPQGLQNPLLQCLGKIQQSNVNRICQLFSTATMKKGRVHILKSVSRHLMPTF